MGRERLFLLILTALCVFFVLVVFTTLWGNQSLADFVPNIQSPLVAPATANPLCRRGGYVLVLRYSGQQGAGVKALSSLQQWMRDLRLPMKIVEPFVQTSVLGMCQSQPREGIRFGDMFDLDQFNAVSRSQGLPEIVPWSVYRSNTYGQAVFVKMLPIEKNISFSTPVITAQASSPCNVTVMSAPDSSSVRLCQSRHTTGYWKFANTHTLSSTEVYDTILRGLEPSNVTLILSLWRGPWEVEKDAASPSLQPEAGNSSLSAPEEKFRDSQNIRNSAAVYQRMFLTGEGRESRYVAVMMRSEHSVVKFQAQHSKNISGEIEGCMEQLVRETEAAVKEVGASGLLVTSDVGRFGSGSWNGTVSSPEKGNVTDIVMRAKRGLERLYEGRDGWSFERWERSFVEASGGIEERGYVAALQRVLATDQKAVCLVLLGGGLFQELSLQQYLQQSRAHPPCVHMVCMKRHHHIRFNSMLMKARKHS